MSRSIWKGPYIDPENWKWIKKATCRETINPHTSSIENKSSLGNLSQDKDKNKNSISKNPTILKMDSSNYLSTQINKINYTSRRSKILAAFIGHQYQIHNGNKFINVKINQELIGHYFGEFAPTKKIAQHKHKHKGLIKKGSKSR